MLAAVADAATCQPALALATQLDWPSLLYRQMYDALLFFKQLLCCCSRCFCQTLFEDVSLTLHACVTLANRLPQG